MTFYADHLPSEIVLDLSVESIRVPIEPLADLLGHCSVAHWDSTDN